MAISQTKYINIISGVGGQAAASRRELIGRLLTSNPLAPVDTVMEMNLAGVIDYFGSSSKEAAFATKYFGFISKNIIQADKISFARYTLTAVSPTLRSTYRPPLIAAFSSISDGSIVINMGGEAKEFTGLDFSGKTSLTECAEVLQTAIQAYTAGGELWTAATVSFADGEFILTGGATGKNSMGAATDAATGTTVAALFGFNAGSLPIVSGGSDAETLTEAMVRISDISNNFGSFGCLDTLTTAQKTELATWNNPQNNRYMYSCSVNADEAIDLQASLNGLNGAGITLDKFNDYADFMSMSLLATTAYNSGRLAVKNYMYQQFPSEKASVTNDTEANLYDGLKINYLGATQQAGKTIEFYQNGVLQGDVQDMGVYCNEIWLKDAIATEFMNLLVALEQLPANDTGAGLARGSIQGIIDEALVNGVIQAGKTLTNVQKAYISQVSGSVNAWRDVEVNGYWLDVQVQQVIENDVTKYIINYVLIYSKGDSIRKVEGSDILI